MGFFFNKPANTTPPAPVPVHPLTREALRLAPDRSLYRLGHSTVLLRLRGGWWLTDPVFSERASPVQFLGPKRFHAPPISLAELPPLRGVILSHDHYDHLDRRAIKALASKTEVFLSPLGVGDRLAAWCVGGPDPPVRLVARRRNRRPAPDGHAGPAFSGRSLADSNRTLWSSWVIEDDELRVFFSGDSGYFDGFAEIGRRFGP